MKKWIFPILITLGIVVSGCNVENDEQTATDSIEVYTTVYPLQYFTEQIGGDYVSVKTIYPPGADEHTFEPSQSDMIKLADSDLFIYVGLGLEGFVEKAKNTLASENVTMVAAAENLDLEGESAHSHDDEGNGEESHTPDGSHAEHSDEEDHSTEGAHDDHGNEEDHSTEAAHDDHGNDEEHSTEGAHDDHGNEEEHSTEAAHDDHGNEEEHAHGDVDPHVWIDPLYSIELAEGIKDALINEMPENKETFEQNFTQLSEKLTNLDKEFHDMAESAKRSEIIVSHAAYGYWEKSYGIRQISVSGYSTTNEPSQKQLQLLITEAKEHNLKHVLFEQNVSSKLAEIVQAEIGGESLMLHNLSVLTDDNIKNNQTYFTLMEENIETLRKALND
ncbi:metal ABC transporter solute-binding protein, Zn/Mn family [Mesobacillus harenae]|uniref:metal ABC transporter solute-binding protein, Zn/Mn family n=1 Tax=Mesobacillus harenae TaxID=2213203 RepID=UPI0015802B20|nr:zinc ABC transporter substrate-binding protein [Mesobacillus harenae]